MPLFVRSAKKLAREKNGASGFSDGSGKTFIAGQFIETYCHAGQLKRGFIWCDRDELRSQGLGAFQNVFGNNGRFALSGNLKECLYCCLIRRLNVDTDELMPVS